MSADNLTDMERVLIESMPRGADLVAKMRGSVSDDLAQRNAHVRNLLSQGLSRSHVADIMGLSKGTVNDIYWRRDGGAL
jgi:DNA-binding NarL/FixJ family response regulator